VLLEHGHAGDDAGLAAGREGVQLEVGGDDGSGEFGVGGCSGAGAPDLRGDVVELFAVLVRYYGAAGGPCVCCDLESDERYELVLGRREVGQGQACWISFRGHTTTPPSKIHPTIVVPVLVAFGRGTPRACKAAFRL